MSYHVIMYLVWMNDDQLINSLLATKHVDWGLSFRYQVQEKVKCIHLHSCNLARAKEKTFVSQFIFLYISMRWRFLWDVLLFLLHWSGHELCLHLGIWGMHVGRSSCCNNASRDNDDIWLYDHHKPWAWRLHKYWQNLDGVVIVGYESS